MLTKGVADALMKRRQAVRLHNYLVARDKEQGQISALIATAYDLLKKTHMSREVF